MKRLRKISILFLSLVMTASCNSNNALTEFSSTDSDEAYYLDAKQKIDDSDWDSAITILTTSLSSDYQARNDVKESLMHAYGGKCGVAFLDLISSLQNVSSSKMFEFALQIFGGRSLDTAACDSAFTALLNLGANAAARTSDQNLFAAILGLTKMGANLHAKFDTDVSGVGDGIVDAGWDACTDSSAANRMSDAEVDDVITGVGLIFENIAVLGDQLTSGSAGGALTDALTSCEAVLGAGSCSIVDESAITPQIRRLFRRMVASSAMGLGTCDITDVVTPGCCPGIANP